MKGIYQFAANLLSYIPAKYYWNRSTSDLVIAKSRRVNFFWNSVYLLAYNKRTCKNGQTDITAVYLNWKRQRMTMSSQINCNAKKVIQNGNPFYAVNNRKFSLQFQVDGAATEKARRASSVCMRGSTSSGASDERRAQGGAWVCTSSLRYVGVAVVRTLRVSTATL